MVISTDYADPMGVMLYLETIGERLRRLRKAKGWSQRKLGFLAGTSGSYISQLEAGLTPRPGYALLQRIAEPLGVSIDVLAGEVEPDEVEVDARLESINANLLTMRALEPDQLDVADAVIAAMVKELRKRKREEPDGDEAL